jgi:hypothetical protein
VGYSLGLSNLRLVNRALLEVEVVVDMPLNSFDVMAAAGLEYVASYPDGTTKVKFNITKHDEDDDGNSSNTSVIPFQIAYAVSIH